MAISSVIVIITMVAAVVTAQEKMSCSNFCSSLGMLQSSPGNSCAEIYQINKASRGLSGLYWINTTNGTYQVTCDMELECGGHKGGWTTIVKFDTSKGDSCPSDEWRKVYSPRTIPRPYCQPINDTVGCYSAIFTTYNIPFNKICGQVKGYQRGIPTGFGTNTKSINDCYVVGLSIILGNPRKHVWTYAIGLSDDYDYPGFNCPCAATPGPDPPAFVGHHYYCESGDTGTYTRGGWYTSDVLWDGYGCHHANNNCCTNSDMPWFFRQFSLSKQDYLEARICTDALVESIELYIQ